MEYKYNRQERLFTRVEPVTIKNVKLKISLDTSYKESEFESKVEEAVNKIESNWDKLCRTLINNLYEIHIESWRYEKESDFSEEDFLSNLLLDTVIINKKTSYTIRFTTGELFQGKILEVIYDNDGSIFVTGLIGQ